MRNRNCIYYLFIYLFYLVTGISILEWLFMQFVSMITEENIGYHILNTKHTYDTMIQQTALRKA